MLLTAASAYTYSKYHDEPQLLHYWLTAQDLLDLSAELALVQRCNENDSVLAVLMRSLMVDAGTAELS